MLPKKLFFKIVLKNEFNQKLAALSKNGMSSSTSPSSPQVASSLYERAKRKLFDAMSFYEEAIGIAEVKQAQNLVQDVILKIYI